MLKFDIPRHKEMIYELLDVDQYVIAYRNRRGDFVARVETDDTVVTDWTTCDPHDICNWLDTAIDIEIEKIECQYELAISQLYIEYQDAELIEYQDAELLETLACENERQRIIKMIHLLEGRRDKKLDFLKQQQNELSQ